MKTIARLTALILISTLSKATADDLFASPLKLFQEALIPALEHSESGGSVTITWRGFILRADSQSGLQNQHLPSEAGICLDASVRDAVEVPKFTDTTTTEKGVTTRTVRFPATGENHEQGLVVTLLHGTQANKEALEAINRSIANIRRRAEQDGAGQPATKPGAEASAEVPEQTETEYPALSIEELAMRFRFPDRYMNSDKDDPAPRDMAFGEMLRRKELQRATAMDEVEFMLGKPSIASGYTVEVLDGGRVEWNYGMMGGGLSIVFDSNGVVSEILEHHDGDPESAHTENLLDSKSNEAEQ